MSGLELKEPRLTTFVTFDLCALHASLDGLLSTGASLPPLQHRAGLHPH